jgi:hypothetical protein
VLREDIVGEREELQKELDLVKKHSSISLKGSKDIDRECFQERGFRVGRRERTRRWGKRSEMQA